MTPDGRCPRHHIGGWYGGPGWWCDCGTQECGYCGGTLHALPPDEDDYRQDRAQLVVIDPEELARAVEALPPIGDSSEGVGLDAVIALIDALGAGRTPSPDAD